MEASTNYNDLTGSAAVDISDFANNDLETLARNFNIDVDRFKPIGLLIGGLQLDFIEVLCEDLSESTDDKKEFVKIHLDVQREDIASDVLKRVEIALFDKYIDEGYKTTPRDSFRSISLSDLLEAN